MSGVLLPVACIKKGRMIAPARRWLWYLSGQGFQGNLACLPRLRLERRKKVHISYLGRNMAEISPVLARKID